MIEETWLIQPVGMAISPLANLGTAVDVGATRGEWTRALAESFKTVVAYEPDGRVGDEITTSDSVILRRQAVSSQCGEATLYRRPEACQSSLLLEHPIGGGSCAPAPVVDLATVPTVTLDSEFEAGADFVKIDVEGVEAEILRGCSPEPWQRTVFVVECHDTERDVAEELARLGKRIFRVSHPSPTAHPGHCWLIGINGASE